MTPEEAAKILQDAATARASAPPRTRKHRRGIRLPQTDLQSDELKASYIE
jgi:hypothetical protein